MYNSYLKIFKYGVVIIVFGICLIESFNPIKHNSNLDYILESGIDKFTISNFLLMSFLNSYLPFELASFAEIASGVSAFFIYYRKNA